jgi:branched-chain amino acid transport system substrate-binding protein
MTVAPVLVAEQLPESNPVKKAAVDFVQRFEKAQGPNSRSLFAATAWDALLIVQNAAREALKKGKPGTPAFSAPRCATPSRACTTSSAPRGSTR